MSLTIIVSFFFIQVNSEKWSYYLTGSSILNQLSNSFGEQSILSDRNTIILTYDDQHRCINNNFYKSIQNQLQSNCPNLGYQLDYKDENVTKEVIFSTLYGRFSQLKNIGSERALSLSADDSLFIFLSGLGGKYILGVQNEIIESDEIVAVLKFLKKQCRYIFVVIDASNSASLIEKKLTATDTGIIVITSTDSKGYVPMGFTDQSQDIAIESIFGARFFEYINQADNLQNSVADLYESMKQWETEINPQIFGDESLLRLPLHSFFNDEVIQMNGKERQNSQQKALKIVPSHQMDMEVAKTILASNPLNDEAREVLKVHRYIENFFQGLKHYLLNEKSMSVKLSHDTDEDTYKDCYRRMREFYFQSIENSSKFPASFHYMKYFSNLCSQNLDEDKIIEAMKDINWIMNLRM